MTQTLLRNTKYLKNHGSDWFNCIALCLCTQEGCVLESWKMNVRNCEWMNQTLFSEPRGTSLHAVINRWIIFMREFCKMCFLERSLEISTSSRWFGKSNVCSRAEPQLGNTQRVDDSVQGRTISHDAQGLQEEHALWLKNSYNKLCLR